MRASSALACAAGASLGVAYASGWWVPAGWAWGPVAFWIAACGADMAYTVKHRRFLLKHERSLVLRVLAGRLRLRYAVSATLAAEAALVASSPLLVTHAWETGFLGVAAALAGVVHLSGLAESRSFVRRAGAGPAGQGRGLARP